MVSEVSASVVAWVVWFFLGRCGKDTVSAPSYSSARARDEKKNSKCMCAISMYEGIKEDALCV